MSKHHESAGEAVEVLDRAHAVEIAIQQLCRAMLARPSMTPAEVDVVLARLAAVAAALPQAAQQLGDILQQTKGDYTLEMDTLTETQDPGLAIDTARLHLAAVREPAEGLYRMLDAAHNETAHIAAVDRVVKRRERAAQDITSSDRRPEERQPPQIGGSGHGLPR
jgi:hypothetical protein